LRALLFLSHVLESCFPTLSSSSLFQSVTLDGVDGQEKTFNVNRLSQWLAALEFDFDIFSSSKMTNNVFF